MPTAPAPAKPLSAVASADDSSGAPALLDAPAPPAAGSGVPFFFLLLLLDKAAAAEAATEAAEAPVSGRFTTFSAEGLAREGLDLEEGAGATIFSPATSRQSAGQASTASQP